MSTNITQYFTNDTKYQCFSFKSLIQSQALPYLYYFRVQNGKQKQRDLTVGQLKRYQSPLLFAVKHCLQRPFFAFICPFFYYSWQMVIKVAQWNSQTAEIKTPLEKKASISGRKSSIVRGKRYRRILSQPSAQPRRTDKSTGGFLLGRRVQSAATTPGHA